MIQRSHTRSLLVIGTIIGAITAAFAYTGGLFSPARLTPARMVDALAPPKGPALGYRRNHAKGVCFTGTFEASGAGTSLSKAQVFTAGRYPVTGRFNLGTPDPKVVDATVRVRGIGLRITTPDGEEWRSSMIDLPFFPVATPEAFYELLVASARQDDPDAMKRFAAAHPEIGTFAAWAGSAPFTASYAEERFNALNSFSFSNAAGVRRVVRWSLIPAARPAFITEAEMKAKGPDFLEGEIADRVAAAPQHWTLAVTMAEPGDPTSDPSKAWPDSRHSVDVGTLVVDRVLPEPDGPCRELNFDPTVLPSGMVTSDDPFPAARSAAYSVSYNRRTAEAEHYPRISTEARP